jgi:hypothetical protein
MILIVGFYDVFLPRAITNITLKSHSTIISKSNIQTIVTIPEQQKGNPSRCQKSLCQKNDKISVGSLCQKYLWSCGIIPILWTQKPRVFYIALKSFFYLDIYWNIILKNSFPKPNFSWIVCAIIAKSPKITTLKNESNTKKNKKSN